MGDTRCQLLEDIEGLCKRCYHLQKSNNDMYDYIKEDSQLQEYIDENDKIIEKYHQKINEIFQLINDISQNKDISFSPIAIDYKTKEDEEKKLCDEKKKNLNNKIQIDNEKIPSDDKGIFL